MNTMTLQALAEPNRVRIVEFLRTGPSSVGEIARKLLIRQPQVSKHLHALSEAGIVERQIAAQKRIYQLQAKPFEELTNWLDTFSSVWESRLDTLDQYVKQLKKG